MSRRYPLRSATPSANLSPLGRDHATVGDLDRPAEARIMDLKVVREEAIEATTRAFWDRNGFVPDQDSEEWDEEYRRQFEQARKRHATGVPVAVKPSVADTPAEEAGWAVLTG